VALFILLQVLVHVPAIRARRGFVAGAFLAGYGVARFIGEFFRQPDAFLGFLFAGATMGQLLSVPMILVGAWLMLRARPAPQAVAA
jgi:phosphatidylglycerol---prolipoprotein diacylglyceryl transferase